MKPLTNVHSSNRCPSVNWLDNCAYLKEEIARRDEIDLPFVPDERVIGAWAVHSEFRSREEFDPAKADDRTFCGEMRFSEDGSCIRTFGGKEAPHMWSNGVILDKANRLACAYELVRVSGTDYLIAEWKNGDYIYGGMDPYYAAYVRVE